MSIIGTLEVERVLECKCGRYEARADTFRGGYVLFPPPPSPALSTHEGEPSEDVAGALAAVEMEAHGRGGREVSLGTPSTFWDEERQRSELRIGGWTLYGDSAATMAVFDEIHRLINASADLRLHILEISRAVNRASDRAVRE